MSWLDDDGDDDDLDYDEADIRVRPNPKANRPRTKRRPAHADAQTARVLGVDRGRYTVLIDEDGPDERQILATRARELRKQPIVNGDRARVVGDTSGDDGTLARIVGIEERTSLLRRSADDTDQVERIIVANARAENARDQARAESRKLRAALALASVEVSSHRTWCILCRTEYRGDGLSRVEHPHDRACALYAVEAR